MDTPNIFINVGESFKAAGEKVKEAAGSKTGKIVIASAVGAVAIGLTVYALTHRKTVVNNWTLLASKTVALKSSYVGIGGWVLLASKSVALKSSSVGLGSWVLLSSSTVALKSSSVGLGTWVLLATKSVNLKVGTIAGIPKLTTSSVVNQGSNLLFSFSGFVQGATVQIGVQGNPVLYTFVTANSNGSGSGALPISIAVGNYTLYAQANHTPTQLDTATATFQVIPATNVTLASTTITKGGKLTFSFVGFQPNSEVFFDIRQPGGAPSPTVGDGSVNCNSQGASWGTISITDNDPTGSYIFAVHDNHGHYWETLISVVAATPTTISFYAKIKNATSVLPGATSWDCWYKSPDTGAWTHVDGLGLSATATLSGVTTGGIMTVLITQLLASGGQNIVSRTSPAFSPANGETWVFDAATSTISKS